MSTKKRASSTAGGTGSRPSKSGKSQEFVVDSVLQKLRTLRNVGIKSENDSPVALPSDIVEVEDLKSKEVCERIADLAVSVVSQIMASNSFEYAVPSRSSSNQRYIEGVDRIVLGDKVSKRQFLNTSHVRKSAITTRVVQLVHEILRKEIHITKRDLFCKQTLSYCCGFIVLLML